MNTQGPKVSHETKSSDGKDKIKGLKETTHRCKKTKQNEWFCNFHICNDQSNSIAGKFIFQEYSEYSSVRVLRLHSHSTVL